MIRIIPTGFSALDEALYIGGIPCGQITEISGGESCGKTTLCQHVIAQAQKMSGLCAFIDADYCFNSPYAVHCGIQLDRLYLSRPTTAEEALDTVYILARSGAFMVIVIDSLTKLVPTAELSTPFGAAIDASCDRLVSQWLPDLSSAIQRSQSALVLTNQVISGMSAIYHRLESNLSRLALPLHAAVRLKLTPSNTHDESHPVRRVQAQIIKNKFASCSKATDLDIIVNRGIEKIGE